MNAQKVTLSRRERARRRERLRRLSLSLLSALGASAAGCQQEEAISSPDAGDVAADMGARDGEGSCAAIGGCEEEMNPCEADVDPCLDACEESCLDGEGGFYPQSYDGICVADPEEGFICDCGGGSGCGRPLTIDDRSRLAPTVERGDWLHAARIQASALPAELRERLAAWWSLVGALEHASVASFSRFSLQLMSLGAPAELLAEAQQAALDELEHAQLAYGLASAYRGHPVGPGALSLQGLELATEPGEVLRLLIEEACVGELLGTAEAEAAAEYARDEQVCAVYLRIAADERRHAALAWRSLQWLLAQYPTLRERAAETLAAVIARHEEALSAETPHLPEHGLWSEAARHELHRATLRETVRPLVDHLGLSLERESA